MRSPNGRPSRLTGGFTIEALRKLNPLNFFKPLPGEHPALAAALPLLLVAAAFVGCFRVVADPDAYWMLAGGRLVLDQGIPKVNSFSHTYPDFPWIFTQWFAAVVFELAYRAAGFAGVCTVVSLVASAGFLAVYAAARRVAADYRWWVFIPLFMMLFVESRFRFTPRGDSFTIIFIPLVPLLWNARPKRMAYFAAALGALWANVHAGAVFGLAEWLMLGAACLLWKDFNRAKSTAIAAAAFFAGTLVNPGFLEPYLYIYEHSNIINNFPLPIDELGKPTFKDVPMFFFFIPLTIPGLLRAAWKRDWPHVFISLWFGAMAVSVIRFVPYYFFAALPGTVTHTTALFRWVGERLPGGKWPKIAAASLFALLLSSYAVYGGRQQADWFSLGVSTFRYPVGACDFIERENLPGKIFNEFDQGGYVSWALLPERKVFIDGRGTAYPMQFFKDAMAYHGQNLFDVLDKYGVDVAIVQRRPDSEIDLGRVFDRFNWQLVYIESTAYVYVRPNSQAGYRTLNRAIRVLRPWEDTGSIYGKAKAFPAEMKNDIRLIEQSRVFSLDDVRKISVAAFLCGAYDLSQSYFEHGLKIYPRHPHIEMDYGTVLSFLGNKQRARELFQDIVDRFPGTSEAENAKLRIRQL